MLSSFGMLSSQNIGNISKDDSIVLIDEISIVGNKVTKSKIIFRELEFAAGDNIPLETLDSLITKSQQNLMNRGLFNFVTITKTINYPLCDLKVSVVERWYIWPVPIVQFADRNINSWIDKKDLSRVNYGIDLRIDNFRGQMEKLDVVIQGGYDIRLFFNWEIPYISKNQIFGMGFSGGVQLNHEIAYSTVGNKEQFYSSSNGFAQQIKFINTTFSFRPKYNYSYGFNIGYNQYTFQDTVLELNPQFASGGTTYDYFSVHYGLKLDYRDYKPFPLDGYYFDFSMTKLGLGIFNNSINYFSVQSAFDQYVNIYKRWYFAYNLSAKFTNQNERPPYFIKTGLGYYPISIRGYELYVVDGQMIGLYKSNFLFEVLPRKKFNINWIKSTKFNKIFFEIYAHVFFDAAYVSNTTTYKLNPLSNQLLWSTGIGVDIISYYDLVFRIEYSVNKQNDRGVYISFVAPI